VTRPLKVPDEWASRLGWAGGGKQLLDEIESRIEVREGCAIARYADLRLESVFQPVISLAHGRAVGFEALVRAYPRQERRSVPPADVFMRAAERGESVLVDGLCRALHLVNFEFQQVKDAWVFVNMTPSSILATGAPDPLFSLILDRHGVPAHRVVIEILESKTYDEELLADVVRHFRELGCVVALDDFGAGQSNFERIWRIVPDVVKLDRSMLEEATREPRVRRIMPGLVGLLHEAGCLVVMEGIEDEHQALIAMEMDVDFVQGFHFGSPDSRVDGNSAHTETMRQLFQKFRSRMSLQNANVRSALARYTRALDRSAMQLVSGVELEIACTEVLEMPGVDRSYLLDGDGVQVGRAILTDRRLAHTDPRYRPFADCEGANWGRRPYFRRAITRPGVVQISQPYLSMTDARSCITLSIGVALDDRQHVLCADLDWESWEPMSSPPSWRPPPNLGWKDIEDDSE
jgi:EAL domain-containing protein (putative c-di-GMP-specific phosphodiesterase class I)